MKKNFLFLLTASMVIALSGCQSSQKTEKLFNGENMDNWQFIVQGDEVPATDVYSIVDGAIHIKGSPLGYMYTKEKYGNYKLHVEWRWPVEASNSGIFVLIENARNPFPDGIECQLAAGKAGDLVMLGNSELTEFSIPEGQERPKFPILTKQKASNEKPVGQWNEADITVTDGVITVYINGELQNTATNTKVKTGHIGLQSEGKDVEFRNVTLERL